MRNLEDYRTLKQELAKWNNMTPTSYAGSIARKNKIKELKHYIIEDCKLHLRRRLCLQSER